MLIVSQNKVRQHVFKGKSDRLCEGTSDDNDILVVDKSSHTKLYGESGSKYLGRLIRFKDLTVRYAGSPTPERETTGVGDNIYPQWLCSAGIPSSLNGGARAQVVQRSWYKMAYSVNGIAQYGSILVTYKDGIPESTNTAGVYTIRTSGYSRFAGNFIPKDGSVGDVLAIYGLYSKYWDYGFGTYQLSINRFEDMQIETEPKDEYPAWSNYLTMVEKSFPQYTLVPLTDDAIHTKLVATWKANYLANKPAEPSDDAELLAKWNKWNEWGDWVVWCLENTTKEAWLLPQYLTEDDDTE